MGLPENRRSPQISMGLDDHRSLEYTVIEPQMTTHHRGLTSFTLVLTQLAAVLYRSTLRANTVAIWRKWIQHHDVR